jgi:hypothetical protein
MEKNTIEGGKEMSNGVGAAGVAGAGLGVAGIILDIVSLSLALDQSDVLIEVKRDIEDIEKLCVAVHNKVFETSDVEEPGRQVAGQGGEIVTTWQRGVQAVKVFLQESAEFFGEVLHHKAQTEMEAYQKVFEFAGRVADTYMESFAEALKDRAESEEIQFEGAKGLFELMGEYFKERFNKLQEMKQEYPFLFFGPLAQEENDTIESPFNDAGYLASRKDLSSMEPVAMRMIPEAVKRQREMGGAGVAGKTAEPGGRSVTEGDVIAIALAVAEKMKGEAAQVATGSGGEAADRGQRDEEGRILSDADIAAVRAVVVDSFAQAGQPNGQPAIGATDIAQTASANHEQLIQLLSAIKGGEDQIFLYQQLAYSDLVAVRNQLKEMGCDPISNMYDHRNMKI